MILITGGLGYIGSHLALHLMAQGQSVVLVDNLLNTNIQVLERLEYISQMYIPFVKLDVRNTPALNKVFEQYPIKAVVHCAGFKSASESKYKPLDYYNDNLNCILSLLRAMQWANVYHLVHVSSLMVYNQSSRELDEKMEFNTQHQNPYVRSLQMIEQIIKDTYVSNPLWNIAVLRMSNIAGAYENGILGEMIPTQPKNIVSLAMQVAGRQRESIELHNYGTSHPEGTVERHFLHVMDGCDAIAKALVWLARREQGYDVFNVSGYEAINMHQVVNEISRITQRAIPTVEIKKAPEQDVLLQIGAKNIKAHCTLQWRGTRDFQQMLQDQWRFYENFLKFQ